MEKEKEETKKKKVISKAKDKIKEARKNRRKEKPDEITTNATFNLLEVIIIILITGVVVSIISGLIVYNNYGKIRSNNDANNTISTSELNELIDNYNIILNSYVDEVNKKELLDAAISGMYSYLGDAYTTYISPDETDTLTDQLEGQYEGIGVEIITLITTEGKNITAINRVFKDSPADKAGMKAGDILLKLDGIDLSEKDSSFVANYIKNGNKSKFEIVISRDDKEKTINIERSHVIINSVSSEVYGNIGYIKLDTFAANTDELIKNEIDKFDKDVNRLIIDLRDNTGGLLTQAEKTSDLFLEEGKAVYQIKDRDGLISTHQAKYGVYRKFDKIAVLVNENSASASEILALALKESAGAKIVGTKTYGKGTVQDTKRLDSGAMVKYTTSYWLSPNGNSINLIGITPDVLVEDVNKQLEKAKEAVK